jgi:hypothetical protein
MQKSIQNWESLQGNKTNTFQVPFTNRTMIGVIDEG